MGLFIGSKDHADAEKAFREIKKMTDDKRIENLLKTNGYNEKGERINAKNSSGFNQH